MERCIHVTRIHCTRDTQKEASGGGVKRHRKGTEARPEPAPQEGYRGSARTGSGPPAGPHNNEPLPGWLRHQAVSS